MKKVADKHSADSRERNRVKSSKHDATSKNSASASPATTSTIDATANIVEGCYICHFNNNQDQILLCERCNGEYHLYCLQPPLVAVPEHDWYCKNCTDFDPLRTHVSRDLNETGTFIDDGLDRQVKSLPYSITKRYGEIVFAQGGTGYGWWPCQIYDPRHAIDPNVRHMAQKYLYSRYLVYFFNCTDINTGSTNNNNTTTTTATNHNHNNNSNNNGLTNNNNTTNNSNAATNSNGNNNSNINSNSATGTSNPFSILGPKMIKSWIVGLSEDLYFGRAARNHGKQRYRSFCDAFQLACIEYDKGNNKSIEHQLRPVLDSYLCQASNRGNTINSPYSNNNLQFATKNVRHETFLMPSPRKIESNTYQEENFDKDISSSTNVNDKQHTGQRKRDKRFRFRKPNKRHRNLETHNAVVDLDDDDDHFNADSDEPHPAFDGLVFTKDVVQESLAGLSTSKNRTIEFSTTLIDGDESIVYHIESSSSPNDHDMMVQSKILVNPLVSNKDENSKLSANTDTASYDEKLQKTSDLDRQGIVNADEATTTVFPNNLEKKAPILESEDSISIRIPEQKDAECTDRFTNVSTSIQTELKKSQSSQRGNDTIVTSVNDSTNLVGLQGFETLAQCAQINVSKKLEGDRLQQQQSKESVNMAKRHISSLDVSMVPVSVNEIGEKFVENPILIQKKEPKGQEFVPHVQFETKERTVQPMLESYYNSKTACNTSIVDEEESLISSIVADAMTEIEEEQVMQSKKKHKRPALDNQYTTTKEWANSISLFPRNSSPLKANFEESTRSSYATDYVVYDNEEKQKSKKKAKGTRKHIGDHLIRHEQIYTSILSLSPTKVIPKLAINQGKTLIASFKAANFIEKSKHTRRPRGRPRKINDGLTTINTKGHLLQSQPRKRGRPKKAIQQESLSNRSMAEIDQESFANKSNNKCQPKRKPGRPRKIRTDDDVPLKPKGKRGRPKKEKPFGTIANDQPARKRGRPPKIRDDGLPNQAPPMETPLV